MIRQRQGEAPAPEMPKDAPRHRPPQARPDRLLTLQRAAGNAAACRMLARQPEDEKRHSYPWNGEIQGTSAAALRGSPAKKPDDPHTNTIADLPRGTAVRVVSRQGAWLRVAATVKGEATEGYVSQELVRYVSASAFEVPPIEITVDLPTVAEAFVELKTGETKKAKGTPPLTEDEVSRLELCASVLEATKKYVVDQARWKVDFVHTAGQKTKVLTIEDFILFVETVERTYPSAKPADIVSEVRQMWFSDPSWAVMVASQGVRGAGGGGGGLVDIETESPIATTFDMRQIAPNRRGSDERGLKLVTRMGVVDMSHVMAGLDARISGSPSSYPEGYLEDIESKTGSSEYDTFKNTAVHETLQDASGGDVRDFATWAGDLGQVYAEFLVDRYLKDDTAATLAGTSAAKMPRDQLLGDIHGYIIKDVWVHTRNSPAGVDDRISNILRDMYLLEKPAAGSYATEFAATSGKPAAEHKRFITERVLAFARLWFAKGSYAIDDDDSWTPYKTIMKHAGKFNGIHARHEASGDPNDKLEVLVEDLLKELGGVVK